MIRRGKAENWLQMPSGYIPKLASAHGVTLNGVQITSTSQGLGLLSRKPDGISHPSPLIEVPKEHILCKQNVELHSRADKHLRDVLSALGDFGKVWEYFDTCEVDLAHETDT